MNGKYPTGINNPAKNGSLILMVSCALMLGITTFSGCPGMSGYSSEPIFPQGINSVCLDMFENQSFRRGVEYELTDALAKRIEADTPYKIISSKDRADSVITGRIVSIDESILTTEREIGRALEKEVRLTAVVTWKNLKTGELLINNHTVASEATYSDYQMQGFTYASTLAANNMAQNIVELMEIKW